MDKLKINIIILFLAVAQPCICQDIKGFIMQQYENWFSVEDSIITIDHENQIFSQNSILLNSNKNNFLASIKSFNVFLSYPRVAVAQIDFERETLFFEISYELLSDCNDDECCCGDSIRDCYKNLNDSITDQKWVYSIGGIYDSDGYSLAIEGLIDKDYMCCPASIKDKDGYVNVRSERDKSSNINGQIKEGEVFFYTPSTVSNWWRVSYNHGQTFIGYVHKSRIVPYQKCTSEMKNKIEDVTH